MHVRTRWCSEGGTCVAAFKVHACLGAQQQHDRSGIRARLPGDRPQKDPSSIRTLHRPLANVQNKELKILSRKSAPLKLHRSWSANSTSTAAACSSPICTTAMDQQHQQQLQLQQAYSIHRANAVAAAGAMLQDQLWEGQRLLQQHQGVLASASMAQSSERQDSSNANMQPMTCGQLFKPVCSLVPGTALNAVQPSRVQSGLNYHNPELKPHQQATPYGMAGSLQGPWQQCQITESQQLHHLPLLEMHPPCLPLPSSVEAARNTGPLPAAALAAKGLIDQAAAQASPELAEQLKHRVVQQVRPGNCWMGACNCTVFAEKAQLEFNSSKLQDVSSVPQLQPLFH